MLKQQENEQFQFWTGRIDWVIWKHSIRYLALLGEQVLGDSW